MAYAKKKYTKKTGKRTYKRPPSSSNKSVTRIVKKVMARAIENKIQNYYVDSMNIYGSNHASFNSSCFMCSPYSLGIQINQGVGQGNRIGNSVTTKSLILKGIISPQVYSSITNNLPVPIFVRLWFYYSKNTPTTLTPPDQTFIQLGGASAALSGTLTDTLSKVNTDNWGFLMQKTFKIGFADYSGSGTSAPWQSYTNNDFKMVAPFSINLTKHCLKRVKFNDNSSFPTVRGIICCPQVMRANNQALIPSDQIVARMSYSLEYSYEDA